MNVSKELCFSRGFCGVTAPQGCCPAPVPACKEGLEAQLWLPSTPQAHPRSASRYHGAAGSLILPR